MVVENLGLFFEARRQCGAEVVLVAGLPFLEGEAAFLEARRHLRAEGGDFRGGAAFLVTRRCFSTRGGVFLRLQVFQIQDYHSDSPVRSDLAQVDCALPISLN